MTQPNAGPSGPAAPGSPPPFSLMPSEEPFAGPLTQDEKTMGLLCYLIPLAGLIIWLTRKENSKFLDACGKEVVNFIISIFLYTLGLSVATFPLHYLPFAGCMLMILWGCFGLAIIVFVVLGALKANSGIVYRMPLCLRLIK